MLLKLLFFQEVMNKVFDKSILDVGCEKQSLFSHWSKTSPSKSITDTTYYKYTNPDTFDNMSFIIKKIRYYALF